MVREIFNLLIHVSAYVPVICNYGTPTLKGREGVGRRGCAMVLHVQCYSCILQGVLPEAFAKVDNPEIKEIIEGCIRNKKGTR